MSENLQEAVNKRVSTRKSAITAISIIKQWLGRQEPEEGPPQISQSKKTLKCPKNEDYTPDYPNTINIGELLKVQQEQVDHELILPADQPILKANQILATRTLKHPTEGSETISGSIETDGTKFQVTCDLCGEKFQTKFKFNRHIKSAHNLDLLKCVLKCKYCPQKSKTTQDLKFHTLMCHMDALNLKTQWFECSKCHFKSIDYKDLESHKRELYGCESGVVLIYHACIECPYRSDRVSTVQGHIKYHYKAGGNKCPHCTFRCARSNIKVMEEHLALHKNSSK